MKDKRDRFLAVLVTNVFYFPKHEHENNNVQNVHFFKKKRNFSMLKSNRNYKRS